MSKKQSVGATGSGAESARRIITHSNVRKLTTIALLAALSYVVMAVGRIPVITIPLVLKYDPKDVIIAVAGFIFGPLSAFAVSAVVSLVEMITVSETGPWGLLMNIISTCAFVCPAAYIYKKRHSINGAIAGLVVGGIFAVAVMMLWNYIVTPIYTGYPRRAVAELLLPVFLPFNALKIGLNATLTILLYKPAVKSLRKMRLVDTSPRGSGAGSARYGVIIITSAVFITLAVLVLVMRGII